MNTIEGQIIWVLEMQLPFLSEGHDYQMVGVFSSPEMAMWCVQDELKAQPEWLSGLPTDTANGLRCYKTVITEVVAGRIHRHGFRICACTLDGMYLERRIAKQAQP